MLLSNALLFLLMVLKNVTFSDAFGVHSIVCPVALPANRGMSVAAFPTSVVNSSIVDGSAVSPDISRSSVIDGGVVSS